jgi:putative transposase
MIRSGRATQPRLLYADLAATEEARQAAYRSVFAEALVDEQVTEIRAATNGGLALGSERFEREVATMLERRTWRGRLGRPRTPEPEAGQIELPI